MTQPSTCDLSLLKKSLEDQLSEAEEAHVIDHLDECSACQTELERMAAKKADWSKVAIALQSDSAVGLRSSSSRSSWVDDSEKWDTAADFAVHFLEPAQSDDAIGRLGDVDVFEVIGHGGMGIVLKGWQDELNRPVAVKVLVPHLASSGAARKRFAREAQAAAMIMHPNVMSIHAVHSSGPLPYLVMPFVSSESLRERINRNGPMTVVEILRIGLQIARGLAAAHAQGLVHRDIKPANVLLEHGNDRVLITDFGLARAADDASLTRSGVIAGTPQFMSPEQARGEAVDFRSDLFSLGSVLYELATGHAPFRAETSYGILRRISDDEPRPIQESSSDVPTWLSSLIEKLHKKQADQRIQTASELADLLEQCLAHVQQPQHVTLPGPLLATTQATRRTRPVHWLSLTIVFLFMLSTGFIWRAPLGELFGIGSTGDSVTNHTGGGQHPDTNPSRWESHRMALDADNSMTDTNSEVVETSGDVSQGNRGFPRSQAFRWDDGVEQALDEVDRAVDQMEQKLESDLR